ncbi:MAG: branched-chain amino acid ABC transporter permease [Nitrososphaerales archaeon]
MINGVLLGLTYGLVGLGLSLVLGIMGILNISHGALYMLGGFIAYFVSVQRGLPPLVGIFVAVGTVFLIGMAIDRSVIKTVSNNQTSVMIITFGLAVVFEQVALLFWGGNPVSIPPLVRSTIVSGSLYVQSQILFAAIIGLLVSVLTIVFLRISKIGKAMRMVSQNKEIASVLGVSTGKISAVSLGLGSSFAALAGTLLAPVYLDYPSAQWQVLIAAFVVVIVGGLGSVAGSMVGGLIYGILETLGSYFVPAGADTIVLILIIVIIIVRPSGLFGLKDRI